MGQCTFAKDLWIKIEKTYESKNEYLEENSIKINEGQESPKFSNSNDSKCDDVGKKEDLEANSIKINEGKEYPKSSNCNDSKCDDVGKKEDVEYNSIKINEGKESPKTLDCNISKSDDVEYFSTSEEEKLEIVCVELDDSYPME
jgi:hypothetical protein